MHLHDAVLVLIAFFSELLGTLSGFGSSTFFVPTATLFETFKFVLALTALLHCFSNISKIYLFRKRLDKKLVLRFALPFVVLCGVGAVLNKFFSAEGFEKALGIFLVVIASLKIFRRSDPRPSEKIAFLLNAISGFLTGFIGTGGALRGIALATLGLEKSTFVFLSSAIDFGGDLLRAIIYLLNGYMDWTQWFYVPLLLLAAYSGARTGKFVLDKINQNQFEKIVSIFVFASGLIMIFQTT